MNEENTGIVVAGGGFAGIWAALAARRVLGDGAMPITVINRDPYLTMRPRLYEGQPEAMRTLLAPTLEPAGVQLMIADVTGFDPARRQVFTDRGEVQYARLVVGLGSRVKPLPVPGREYALDVDSFAGAVALDKRLAGLQPPLARVVIVGAGFTGIELATELRPRLTLYDARMDDALEIVLIDNASVVGMELGDNPRPAIDQALADARVEVMLNTCIASVDAAGLTLVDGQRLDADVVVNCTGMAAHPLVASLGEVDIRGRLVVDECLRVADQPEIFVAGDSACAHVDDQGHQALMSCQHAMIMGRFAGFNAACDLTLQPLRPYRQENYVTCLDLGASGAVFTQGWDRQVMMTGAEANDLKRHINTEVIYPPTNLEAILEQAALPPRG